MRALLRAAIVPFFLLGTACAQGVPADQVHDLSLLVSPKLPCVWPVGMMPHVVTPTQTFGPGAYHRELIAIDEHTGTQFDAPAHFVPPPGSGLPGAGPNGLVTAEKVPVWQFCGEACVIDVSAHLQEAENGSSYLIGTELIQSWEKQHRPLAAADVVLFRSGYTDRFYQPYPSGERFVHTALQSLTPGWPGPTPEAMQYVGGKGVKTMGLDSPSMGPLPKLAAATHQAGGQLGMVWTECATGLGKLPATGAFYAMLPPKHAAGSGSECRALAITEPKLAARLIASARAQRVADLSVTLDENSPVTWPGARPGEEASRYLGMTLNAFLPARGPYFARGHLLDAQVGTHVVLPGFALPPAGFDEALYAPATRELAAKFAARFGRRAAANMTLDQAPLAQLMGEAHVVDVRSLLGTTKPADWPASPPITVELLKAHDAQRPFRAGEVVLFYSGYTPAKLPALPPSPQLDGHFAAPLAGKAEGWPAPTAEAVAWLADKGIRCLGTDGPTLGGANPEQALWVYWLAGTRGLLPVEHLTNLGEIAQRPAFFLFAPVKIAGVRSGGYGRAIALY